MKYVSGICLFGRDYDLYYDKKRDRYVLKLEYKNEEYEWDLTEFVNEHSHLTYEDIIVAWDKDIKGFLEF